MLDSFGKNVHNSDFNLIILQLKRALIIETNSVNLEISGKIITKILDSKVDDQTLLIIDLLSTKLFKEKIILTNGFLSLLSSMFDKLTKKPDLIVKYKNASNLMLSLILLNSNKFDNLIDGLLANVNPSEKSKSVNFCFIQNKPIFEKLYQLLQLDITHNINTHILIMELFLLCIRSHKISKPSSIINLLKSNIANILKDIKNENLFSRILLLYIQSFKKLNQNLPAFFYQ